jgi:hypothetical protein
MVRQTFFKNKYCKASKIILTIIVGMKLFSCSPQVNVMRNGFKSYPPREENDSVVIYKKAQDIPIESEKIGTLQASCNPLINNCDSASIFSLAKMKIKKAGGNALLITNFEKPTLLSSMLLSNRGVFLLSGDVFLVHDFSSLPDTVKKMNFQNKYMYAGLGFGPETGISLPKISIYSFQNRKNFETYYGAEVGIWGLVAFWMSLDCLYGIKKNIFTMDTSLGAFWAVPPDGTRHYFHTTMNPKIGVKFWKLWLKAGPSIHLYRSDSDAGSFGKIGNMYYNFEILIKL